MGSLLMEPDDVATYASIFHPPEGLCLSVENIHSRGIFHGARPFDYSVPRLLAQLSLASSIIFFTSRLLRPLHQTTMVSHILGGLLLGPSFLGHFSTFTATVFPFQGLVLLDGLAILGYMFYFFLIGVKIDISILKSLEKRDFIIGISTVALAIVVSISWSLLIMGSNIKLEPEITYTLPIVGAISSVLAFPMVAHYLTELNMLNSAIGRMALTTSLISNLFSYSLISITIISNQHGGRYIMLRSVLVTVVMAIFYLFPVRALFVWLLRRIPEGQPLKRGFIYLVLVGILMSGLCSHASNMSIFYGPLLYGMAIPAGPPLGSALVEKLELINSCFFMPLYYVKNGLVVDIFSVKFKNYLVVQFIILVACTGKFLGALISSVCCNVPPRDAISLGLVMNIQGLLELGMFKMMKQSKAIDNETFVVLCVSLVIVSATITPIMRHLYDPTKRYTVYKRRTILLSKPDSELCILACLHNEENLPTTINILEAINPTKRTPICIYALHLVELVGRLDPLLISHKLMKKPSTKASTSKGIVNAFRLFEQSYGRHIASAHPFTAVAAYPTMHDEVCAMALDKRVSLIIIPFHKRLTDSNVTTELNKKAIRMMNDKILKSAPCSVVIIVDRGLLHSARPALSTWSPYRIAVLFLGGADDREALALGARMAGQPNINLTIVRLLENRQTPGGQNTSSERNADNDVVSEFRRNLDGNY